MRKQFIGFMAAFVFVSVAVTAQTPEEKKPETLWISETAHNFGKIPQGKPVTTYFELKTTTSDSLKLEGVQASCGCTTPEFKVGTYAPGEPIKIKVGYNAANPGSFTKAITITYNSGKQKVVKLSGTSWVTVGDSDFSTGQGSNQKLAFAPDGSLYIAYADSTLGKPVVRKLTTVVTPAVVCPSSGPIPSCSASNPGCKTNAGQAVQVNTSSRTR